MPRREYISKVLRYSTRAFRDLDLYTHDLENLIGSWRDYLVYCPAVQRRAGCCCEAGN